MNYQNLAALRNWMKLLVAKSLKHWQTSSLIDPTGRRAASSIPSHPAGPSPSWTSCLSPCSVSCVSITAKRKVYYALATIAHNGPLFWLDVVERSLVKHISSTIMSHPAFSIPFYLRSLPLHSFCSASGTMSHIPFIIIYPSYWEYFHRSSGLVLRKKNRVFLA